MVCKKMEKTKEKELLEQTYGLRRKRFTWVMEKLKQRITAKATKIKRYDNRINNFNATGISRPTMEDSPKILKKEDKVLERNMENES